ncbi:glycosyltransferase family 2 protein [Schleiferilactobacillus harbinensis]|uniref:glycosyltransferase family 2 protein n=1 Tax=Schleiferilactobacillus harbinensis TaxID=304207 RepID=UPI001AAE9B57|nr:glycosyltransferase family 2 protein [Schleiferilactobacillus harbinensis]MBO3092452.1 glycosyltransferase family 2 protein [Schleiferilactobacillus harbinensis]
MIETGLSILFEIAMYIFLTYVFLSIFLRKAVAVKKDGGQIEVNGADDPPFYYMIIPGMNEALVIQQTLAQMAQYHFQGKIVMIDDASADGTADLAEQTAAGDDRIVVIRRHLPRAHIGKGDSLNQVMDYVKHDCRRHGRNLKQVVIGVLDADGVLSTDAITQLNRFFQDPDQVICQLRVKMDSPFTSALQVSQDLEFFSVNNMSQNMRMRTHTVGLSGNGQFFRLLPVLKAVGWHPWGHALLDDYELTLKLMLHGIHVQYIDSAFVYQQALTSPYKLLRQRSRWVQGNLYCIKYFKAVMTSQQIDVIQKVGILYFLAQPWINVAADLSVFGLTIITGLRVSQLLVAHPSLLVSALITGGLLFLFSQFWGFVFSAFYIHDLHMTRMTVPKWTHLVGLPSIVSYMYVLLFGSLVMAYWRKLRGNNSWVKTARQSVG